MHALVMVCAAISGVRCGLDRWVRPVGLEKGLEGRRIYIRGVRKKRTALLERRVHSACALTRGLEKKAGGRNSEIHVLEFEMRPCCGLRSGTKAKADRARQKAGLERGVRKKAGVRNSEIEFLEFQMWAF